MTPSSAWAFGDRPGASQMASADDRADRALRGRLLAQARGRSWPRVRAALRKLAAAPWHCRLPLVEARWGVTEEEIVAWNGHRTGRSASQAPPGGANGWEQAPQAVGRGRRSPERRWE